MEGTRLWKQHIYPLFKKTKTSPSAETMNLMFQETYKILETVALHLKRHSSSNSSSRAVSWHAALSHLGDLHRYHLSSSINSAAGGDVNHLRFLKTASFDFYREASLLSPNNGLYLSQMGSVVFLTASTSVMNNDDRGVSPFMDHVVACYYFSRSLCVASPFKSAKESLSLLLRSSSSVSSTNALQLFLAITEYIYFSIK